jgi:hypothetical protein
LIRFDDRVTGEIGCLNGDFTFHHGSVRTGMDWRLREAIEQFKQEAK